MQSPNWVIVWHVKDFTGHEFAHMQRFLTEYAKRGIIAKEKGEEGETPHIQGYFELNSKRTMNGIKALIGDDTIHLEKRKGTAYQAWTYCEKEGDYWIHGTKPAYELDWDEIKARIEARTITELEIVGNVSYQRLNQARLYYHLSTPVRDGFDGIHWISGSPGAGKSRLAHTYEDLYTHNSLNCKWFDGYHGERVMLIDDLRAINWPLVHLLRVADRYPMRVEVKGGMTNFNARVVVITNCDPPDRVYSGVEDLHQLFRRIRLHTNFDTGKTIAFDDKGRITSQLSGTNYRLINGLPSSLSLAESPAESSSQSAPSYATSFQARSESGGRDGDRDES